MADGAHGQAPAHTHAGVIAFRRTQGGPRYLLVSARRRDDEWVFPKGHIEPGETVDQAALREADEEAGIGGTVAGDLGTEEFEAQGERVRVAWRLLHVQRERASPEGRRKWWAALPEALTSLPFEDQRTLLVRANALIEDDARKT